MELARLLMEQSTSSHIESTVKVLNHRIKGSKRFWPASGAEALLQLKADTLNETGHRETFWYIRGRKRRPAPEPTPAEKPESQ